MTIDHASTGWTYLGWFLVLAQLSLFALLAWPWVSLVVSYPGLVLAAAGMIVGLWTLLHNRIGNFNVHPAPKAEGQLVTSGPYRYVRHPMYSAVLLVAVAAVCFYQADSRKIGCWLALLLVLWLKSLLEEQALSNHFREYADYARRVGRFVPRLF